MALAGAVFAVEACGARTSQGPFPSPEPGTSITKIRVQRVDKLDLLFVVDNSISMADEQSELGRRMPMLIKALTNPDVGSDGKKPQSVADLHVGVITSSMGSHGTSVCAPSVTNKHNDDRGHLLPRDGEGGGNGWRVDTEKGLPTRVSCPVVVTATALSWISDPTKGPAQFMGTSSSGGGDAQMQTAVSCVVQSAGFDGCGYPETWEAAYHFLVDPAPYASAEVACTFGSGGDACGSNRIEIKGVDDVVLAQRAAFLRKDSLLAVVVVSDKNDASLKPTSLNWLPWGYGAGQMQRGWKACAGIDDAFEPESAAEYADLRAKGCRSCFENASDPGGNCAVPWAKEKFDNDVDGRNNRGFHMIQRFGYNFLWGRNRYVNAFRNPTAIGSDGKEAVNPIYAGGFRTTDLVLVAAIVGVPRRLIPIDSDGVPRQLTDADWESIVGPVGKRDPHMVEQIAPRADLGIKKFAGDRAIDEINGGDRDIPDGDDLQYACIAPRSAPDGGLDCASPGSEARSPLCAAGGKQPYFKAYPGLRHLRIIRELGTSGFIASICNDTYAPAIQGIVGKLQAAVNAQCLKTVLDPEKDGNVNCMIVESMAGPVVTDTTAAKCEDVSPGYCTPGAKPCRVDGSDYPSISPEQAALQVKLKIQTVDAAGAARDEWVQAVAERGNVYATGSDGKQHLLCEMQQLAGGRVDAETTRKCLTDDKFDAPGGWCYTQDPSLLGDACLAHGAWGKIRFFGNTKPRSGSEVFTICVNGTTAK